MDKLVRPVVILSLCVIAQLAQPPLRAQQPDTSRLYQIDPVVVTATHTDALRSSVPNSFTVLSRRDLDQSGPVALLSVLSHEVPGMFVTERGVLGYGVADGAAGGISIRGSGGNPTTGVLVLTDGRPQMMGLMGHPLPDAHSTAGVERVEVIRGPASLLFGSNAMGGVINIIPIVDHGKAFHGSAHASMGSYGTRRLHVDGSYGFEPGSLQISLGRDATNGHRTWSSFEQTGGSVRGTIPLSPAYSLSPDLSISDFRTYDPGTASRPFVNHWVDVTRGSAGLTLRHAGDRSEGTVKLFANWGRHDIFDGFHSTDLFAGLKLYRSFRLGEAATLTAGTDVHYYGGRAENRTTSFDFGDHRITESAAYIIGRVDSLGLFSLTGGARYNYHSRSGGEIIPQIGVSFRALEGTTLRANVGKGFRSPTIRELFLFPAPTPTLEPERVWNYEIGLTQAFGDRGSLDVSAYLAEGRNMVLTLGAFPRLVLANSGRFTHRGVEASIRLMPASYLSFKGAYSHLAGAEQTTGNPRHKADVSVAWELSRLQWSAGIQWISGLYGGGSQRQRLPDYALARTRLAYTMTSGFSVTLSVENLLDRPYQIIQDYPMPGRTVFLGVRWAG